MSEGRSAPGSPLSGDVRREPLVMVLPDPTSLALAVAAAVVGEARQAVKRSGRFSIALSGGSTPRRTYELLAQPPFVRDISWGSTHVFWSDERCVDPGDPRSNESMAREALLDSVPIPAEHIHAMCGSGAHESGRDVSPDGGSTAEQAEDAAKGYEAMLRMQDAALDLVLLGMGEDGHTASLFPGSDALRERERWVSSAFHDPLWRVTLTVPYINQAAAVFFIVSGAEKAGVLKRVLENGLDDYESSGLGLPAQWIAPASGRLVWFIDEEAAAAIELGEIPATRRV